MSGSALAATLAVGARPARHWARLLGIALLAAGAALSFKKQLDVGLVV